MVRVKDFFCKFPLRMFTSKVNLYVLFLLVVFSIKDRESQRYKVKTKFKIPSLLGT